MKTGVIIGFFLALLAFGSPALAQRWGGGETLDRILPQIRAHHPGRLSDAEPFVGEDGDTHYRIKWMTPEGRIIYFDADGRSGRWTNSRGDGGYAGGNRGYDNGQDGPPRDDYRGGDDYRGSDSGPSRGPSNWQGGRQNWNGEGGRGWPGGRPDWPGGGGRSYPDRGRGDGNGHGWNGGHNWNGGRSSNHHGGH